ncbi:MAG: NAD(P)-dependent glycerol-3-phosphate dehydrogenase [Chloroflexi bacterium]|nr:NAD(P)-dependent glycerol-3-phosphate dehydrogenase [Chloroflexota bacterium]
MPKIAIIGTTSWGITLGTVLARKGTDISLWARTEQEATELSKASPGSVPTDTDRFPPKLSITSSPDKALNRAKAVILAVPSQSMRWNIKLLARHLGKSMLLVSAAKGLEIETGKRMSQVIAEEIAPGLHRNICVLSGPNLAPEILNGLPAAAVVAAEDDKVARQAQKLLTVPNFCIFTNTDVIGVELGGSLKNIIALGAGITDGLGYGDNAKSALITRGLTEMTALGVALGANAITFAGLAGLGDLIATCASSLSRNHYVGVELAKGRSLKEITDSMTGAVVGGAIPTGVAEGVTTTLAVWKLARQMGLEMPITETIYRVLYEGADIRKAAADLMGAEAAHELAGRKWRLFSALRKVRRRA